MTVLLRLLAAFACAAPSASRSAAVEVPALPRAEIQTVAAPAARSFSAVPATLPEAGLEAAAPMMGPRGSRSARASGKAAASRRKKRIAAAGGAGGDGTDDSDASRKAAASALEFDGAAPRKRAELPEPVARLRDLVKEAVLAGGAKGVASISAGRDGVTLGLEPSAKREEVDAFFAARLGQGTASRLAYAVEPPRLSERGYAQRLADAAAEPKPKGSADVVEGALMVQVLEQSLWQQLERLELPAAARSKLGRDARPYFEITVEGSRRDLRRVENLVHDPERGPHFYGPIPVQIRFREKRGR